MQTSQSRYLPLILPLNLAIIPHRLINSPSQSRDLPRSPSPSRSRSRSRAWELREQAARVGIDLLILLSVSLSPVWIKTPFTFTIHKHTTHNTSYVVQLFSLSLSLFFLSFYFSSISQQHQKRKVFSSTCWQNEFVVRGISLFFTSSLSLFFSSQMYFSLFTFEIVVLLVIILWVCEVEFYCVITD